MKYQWILFDADETLYSFNSYFGLKAVLAQYGLAFTEADYAEFQAVNKPLWVDYQNKKITAEQLRTIRFAKLSALTGQSAEQLNLALMAEMALVSRPLLDVPTMLAALHGKVKMGIITNGFDALQQKRLHNTQTHHFFEWVITSEAVGVAKPDPKIFHEAFEKMGTFDKSHVLMVGDTLASDILGANQVGIASCWFNPEQKQNDTDIKPTYEIQTILDLIRIASG
ncbi:dUMP phosphatase [[Actinobacillus] muris]|uniref:DUMP phosphatase n=1 Tax=Muribacter muris TaxID=67855 RepID=A0A0J5P6U7_9PAST|nr:pyrimidine 5'-nucleotidase [Muribacter muris]KMK51981.1 dUMP phosphatase [[Actinobacillus] muris] [Muribacter muris]